jgi:hypothetical protein
LTPFIHNTHKYVKAVCLQMLQLQQGVDGPHNHLLY